MSASTTRRDFPLPACGERVARTGGPSRVRGRATQHRRERNAPHRMSSQRSDVDLSPRAGRGEREQGGPHHYAAHGFSPSCREGWREMPGRSAPSPLGGEGWGGGYSEFIQMPRTSSACRASPPSRRTRMASAFVDLPLKGGGENETIDRTLRVTRRLERQP